MESARRQWKGKRSSAAICWVIYMLDVRRMQVLRAVAVSGSVTAAAAGLGLPPPLSASRWGCWRRRPGSGCSNVSVGACGHSGGTAAHRARDDHQPACRRDRDRAGRPARRAYRTADGPLLRLGRLAAAGPRYRPAPDEHPGVTVDPKLTDPRDSLPDVEQGNGDLAIVVRRPDDGGRPGIRLIAPARRRVPGSVAGRASARRAWQVVDLNLAGEP